MTVSDLYNFEGSKLFSLFSRGGLGVGVGVGVGFGVFWISWDAFDLVEISSFGVVDSGGSDRMPAIKVMWKEVFPQYPILGVGLGGANFNAVARQYGIDHPCHNIFFDSLCQLGIIGFLIFLYIVIHYFKTTYRCIKRTNNELCFLGFFLLLTATINGIGETVYIEKIYWNAIALCVIGIGNATSFSKLIEDGKI